MIQTPFPVPDSLAVDLPIPSSLERWRDLYLHSGFEKLIVFVALGLLLYFVARVAKKAIGDQIEEVNRRHALRKWITYGFVALLLLVAVALFADWLTGLGTILALMLAGVAVALQDVLKSFVGWLYISSRAGYEIGSRIEVNDIIGDVIDIGVLKTTLIEVGGGLVYGRQSTGRLVTVPNYKMISEAVLVAPAKSPYVWHELQTTVTFASDWHRAEEILRRVGDEIHTEVAPELAHAFRHLERRYAFKYGTLTPIVYVSIGVFGVELTLRFLVHARKRRGTADQASRSILSAFAAEPAIRIAYPSYNIYQPGGAGGRPSGGGVPES